MTATTRPTKTLITLSSRAKAQSFIDDEKIAGAWIHQVDRYTFQVVVYA